MKRVLLTLVQQSHQHAITLWQLTDRLEALEQSLFENPAVRQDVELRLVKLRQASALRMQEVHRLHEELEALISQLRE